MRQTLFFSLPSRFFEPSSLGPAAPRRVSRGSSGSGGRRSDGAAVSIVFATSGEEKVNSRDVERRWIVLLFFSTSTSSSPKNDQKGFSRTKHLNRRKETESENKQKETIVIQRKNSKPSLTLPKEGEATKKRGGNRGRKTQRKIIRAPPHRRRPRRPRRPWAAPASPAARASAPAPSRR